MGIKRQIWDQFGNDRVKVDMMEWRGGVEEWVVERETNPGEEQTIKAINKEQKQKH